MSSFFMTIWKQMQTFVTFISIYLVANQLKWPAGPEYESPAIVRKDDADLIISRSLQRSLIGHTRHIAKISLYQVTLYFREQNKIEDVNLIYEKVNKRLCHHSVNAPFRKHRGISLKYVFLYSVCALQMFLLTFPKSSWRLPAASAAEGPPNSPPSCGPCQS